MANQGNTPPQQETEVGPEPGSYRLSDIFSTVCEFEGAQISLETFLSTCDCAHNMVTVDQRYLLIIHFKNKLNGRAEQLNNSNFLP